MAEQDAVNAMVHLGVKISKVCSVQMWGYGFLLWQKMKQGINDKDTKKKIKQKPSSEDEYELSRFKPALRTVVEVGPRPIWFQLYTTQLFDRITWRANSTSLYFLMWRIRLSKRRHLLLSARHHLPLHYAARNLHGIKHLGLLQRPARTNSAWSSSSLVAWPIPKFGRHINYLHHWTKIFSLVNLLFLLLIEQSAQCYL